MSHWLRRLHKWVGLLLAIQFALWMASGVVMSLLDADKVQGKEYRIKPPAPPAWPGNVLAPDAVLAAAGERVVAISSGWLLGRPVYRLQNDKRNWLVDAGNGGRVTIDARLAENIAAASYSGPGKARAAVLQEPTLETRAHKEPAWRVDFDDTAQTSVYVAARSGNVLEHRNSTWRLFDFFWMLHIMDYSERADFNNPLLVSSAIGGLWMALTGVWLLFASVRLAEFVPGRWRRRAAVNLVDAQGMRRRAVPASAGDTVYRALARSGLQLPSNCGGGQSCGLCGVRCVGKAPAPTAADRALLSPRQLEEGFRLACNLPVKRSVDVDIGAALAASPERTGVVTKVDAVTPFLREVTVRPEMPLDCRPGAYVQVHVPAFVLSANDLAIPDHHRQHWQALGLPADLANSEAVRRAYSLAVPLERCGGQLTFLVRFVPGTPSRLQRKVAVRPAEAHLVARLERVHVARAAAGRRARHEAHQEGQLPVAAFEWNRNRIRAPHRLAVGQLNGHAKPLPVIAMMVRDSQVARTALERRHVNLHIRARAARERPLGTHRDLTQERCYRMHLGHHADPLGRRGQRFADVDIDAALHGQIARQPEALLEFLRRQERAVGRRRFGGFTDAAHLAQAAALTATAIRGQLQARACQRLVDRIACRGRHLALAQALAVDQVDRGAAAPAAWYELREPHACKQEPHAGQGHPQPADRARHQQGIVKVDALGVVHDMEHPEEVEQAPGAVAVLEHVPRARRDIDRGLLGVVEVDAPDRLLMGARFEGRLLQLRRFGFSRSGIRGLSDVRCQYGIDRHVLAVPGIDQPAALIVL